MHAGKLSTLFCLLLNVFIKFSNCLFKNTIIMPESLDPCHDDVLLDLIDDVLLGLIWAKTVRKCYRQMTVNRFFEMNIKEISANPVLTFSLHEFEIFQIGLCRNSKEI